jgi:hypothetical protein
MHTRGNMLWMLLVPLACLHLLSLASAAPSSPRQISVILVRETAVWLSWGAVGDAQAYMVFRSNSTVGPFQVAAEIRAPPGMSPSPTVAVSGLVTGRTIFFRVSSGDEAGNYNMDASDVVAATPIGPPKRPVTNVDIVSYNSTAVTLSWELPGSTDDPGPMPTIFSVQYSCDGAPYTRYPIELDNAIGTIVPANGVPLDTTCKFIVGSRNLNYFLSNPWAAFTTPVGLNQFSLEMSYIMASPPGPVASLQAMEASLSSITVGWEPALLALFYRTLYARVLPDGSVGPAIEASRDQTTNVATVTGLDLGGVYVITVEARNRQANFHHLRRLMTMRMLIV